VEEWKEKRHVTYAIVQDLSLDLVVVKYEEPEERATQAAENIRASQTEIKVEDFTQNDNQYERKKYGEPVSILLLLLC